MNGAGDLVAVSNAGWHCLVIDATPVCMIEQMTNADDAAIFGWAFDGVPIYGDANPDGYGIAEGALDVCNGQFDDTFGYRHHTSPLRPTSCNVRWAKCPISMHCNAPARFQT
ncbi:MAG: hypothetical protein ABJL99_15345 [Aliishimia sp.]